MSKNQHTEEPDKAKVNTKKTIILSVIILLAAGAVTTIIFLTEPKAKKGGATKETAMLVDVISVQRGNYRPVIVTTGTVIPSQDVNLGARVSGEITRLSENFAPGGFVRKGEILLQIDPSDYQNMLQLRESDLQQAKADLSIEMGRQQVARQDFELLDETIGSENKSLVLREPQLNAAKSRIDAAQAAVSQAELELQRATIRAPFDGHILNRNVNVGSLVSPGEDLGRIVGIDYYWVEVMVPLAKIRWLSFPDENRKKGSNVKIRNRTSWKEGKFRQGYLHKLIGSLEDQTRLARVLAAVEDPLAQKAESDSLQPLIIGAFMETQIEADEISDIFRLDRDYVRQNQTVWVMEDEKLQIRNVNIIFQDAEYAYITSGLNENDKVVTTSLTTVAEGVSLRTEESNTNNNDSLPGETLQDQNKNQMPRGTQ